MHRHLDRLLLASALVLAGGGWVCQSSTADRCPGALTCGIEVANVCCPFGSGEWCNGCTADATGCPGTRVECTDEAHILDCSFNATIDSARCSWPVSDPNGTRWTVEMTGTLEGCGQETALFMAQPVPAGTDTIDCGDWDEGVYGGCVSPSPSTTTTHWTYRFPAAEGSGSAASLVIERAHGSAPPLAMMSVRCTQ